MPSEFDDFISLETLGNCFDNNTSFANTNYSWFLGDPAWTPRNSPYVKPFPETNGDKGLAHAMRFFWLCKNVKFQWDISWNEIDLSGTPDPVPYGRVIIPAGSMSVIASADTVVSFGFMSGLTYSEQSAAALGQEIFLKPPNQRICDINLFGNNEGGFFYGPNFPSLDAKKQFTIGVNQFDDYTMIGEKQGPAIRAYMQAVFMVYFCPIDQRWNLYHYLEGRVEVLTNFLCSYDDDLGSDVCVPPAYDVAGRIFNDDVGFPFSSYTTSIGGIDWTYNTTELYGILVESEMTQVTESYWQ